MRKSISIFIDKLMK